MKNTILKLLSLLLVPIAMACTIGISYALWKYSTISNVEPASDTYTINFYKDGNTSTPYLTYEDLEFDSRFELPQGLAKYNNKDFIGWSKTNGGDLIPNIYNRYCDLVGSMSDKEMNLYAKYSS